MHRPGSTNRDSLAVAREVHADKSLAEAGGALLKPKTTLLKGVGENYVVRCCKALMVDNSVVSRSPRALLAIGIHVDVEVGQRVREDFKAKRPFRSFSLIFYPLREYAFRACVIHWFTAQPMERVFPTKISKRRIRALGM